MAPAYRLDFFLREALLDGSTGGYALDLFLRERFFPPGGTTFYQSIEGTLTATGAVDPKVVIAKSLDGLVQFSGSIAKLTQKLFSGQLTSSGALVRMTSKNLAGTLTLSGAIVKNTGKMLSGIFSAVGSLTTQSQFYMSLTGVLSFFATLWKTLSGGISDTGIRWFGFFESRKK